MDAKMLESLARSPVFEGLRKADIDSLMSTVSFRVVHINKGAVYALEGDTCRFVDIVINGALQARMTGESGKFVDLTELREGSIVAPALVFAKENRLPVSVDAIVDTDILRMIPDVFHSLIDANARIRWNFIGLLSNVNRFLAGKMRFLSLLSVRERIAAMLLNAASLQGSNTVVLHKSRQELADSFGVQKVSIVRCLTALRDEGVIAIDGKSITILDAKHLR